MGPLILGGLLILVALMVLAGSYVVMLYNGLVTVRQGVTKAWANIDVLLKQRHDEIPKLIETCKEYRQFEVNTLEKVIRWRSAVQEARVQQDIGALGPAESGLRSSLGNLFAVAEAYPVLKTNENFIQLQSRISQLENAIADRRELYNEAVAINNVRVQQFPASIVARGWHFEEAGLLRFDAAETTDVDIKKAFAS